MKAYRFTGCLQRKCGYLPKVGSDIWVYSQDVLLPRIQEFALETWLAYSAPVPANCNHVVSLFLVCCVIAVSVGGLCYQWMLFSLQYSFQFSATITSVISLLALLILFLVHPARCMFIIMVPTLGTKQGRRLLLSTSFMIIAANIVPNIMGNIETILQVIKCICKDSSENILTSTILLGNASWDFSDALKKVMDKLPDKFGRPRDSHVQFETHNNNFVVGQKILDASQGIKEDFLKVEVLVQKILLLANRVIGGFFFFYLMFESAWYLKRYLTDLRFDNIYITKKLKVIAVENKATQILICSPKKLIESTGFKLSREELLACAVHIFLLTLLLMLVLMIIVTDYIAFYLAQAVVTNITQFPIVPVTFWIKYDVNITFLKFLKEFFNNAFSIKQSLPLFERSYHHNLTFISASCSMKGPNPPSGVVIFAVGLLYCILYATVFLETYSHRLCRKISASFFESREDQRVLYLYRKLVRKYKKKKQQQSAGPS